VLLFVVIGRLIAQLYTMPILDEKALRGSREHGALQTGWGWGWLLQFGASVWRSSIL